MRKKKIDSVTAEVEMVRQKAPLPPAHIKLRKQDIPFWESILSVKDFTSWTNTDLGQAAILARCKADIERLQGEMDNEPDIIKNAAGSLVLNPKLKIIEILVHRSISLTRFLQIHAAATVGRSGDQAKRNLAQRKFNDIGEDLDPLFARPIKH
jgi:hypothetical protein